MLSYINAELYRRRRNINNIVLIILGFVAIAICTIQGMRELQNPGSDITRASYFRILTLFIQGMSPFIAALISSSCFKRSREVKNYVGRGNSRMNVVVGDLVTSIINTVVVAAILLAVILGLQYIFPEGSPIEIAESPATAFIKNIIFTVFIVTCYNITFNMLYELINNVGFAVSVGYMISYVVPQIASVLLRRDDEIGKVAEFIYNISPIKFLSDFFGNSSIIMDKYFWIMCAIHFVGFIGITVYASKKRSH